jgi:MraZ protein
VFSGIHSVNLDAKGRLAVPARFRDMLAKAGSTLLTVTINPSADDRCLLLYPEHEWAEVVRGLSRRDTMHPRVRAMQRLVVGHAADCEMDGQGRILLPAPQRKFAGLAKRVSLVGQFNKIEIWDEEALENKQEAWLDDVKLIDGEFAEELRGLRL